MNVQSQQPKVLPKNNSSLKGLLSVDTLKGSSKTAQILQGGKGNSLKPSISTTENEKKLKSESEVKKMPPVTVSTISEVSSPQPRKENETQNKENKEPVKNLNKEPVNNLKKEIASKSETEVKQSKTSQNKENNCTSQTRLQLEKDASLVKTGENLQPSSVKTEKYQTSLQNPPSKCEIVKPTALRIDSAPKPKQDHSNPSIVRPRPHGITPTAGKIPSISPITFKQSPEQRELQNTEIIRKPKFPPKQEPTNKPNITNKEQKDQNNKNMDNRSTTPKISISPSTPVISPSPKKFLKQSLNEREIKQESVANKTQLGNKPENKDQSKLKKDETMSSNIHSKNIDKGHHYENSGKLEIESSANRNKLGFKPEKIDQTKPKKDELMPSNIHSKNSDKGIINETKIKLESPANTSQHGCIPEDGDQNKPKKDETIPNNNHSKKSDKELINENSEKVFEKSPSPDSIQDMTAPLITPETLYETTQKDREPRDPDHADKSEDKPSSKGTLSGITNASTNEEKKVNFKPQVKQESIEDKGITPTPTKYSSKNWF